MIMPENRNIALLMKQSHQSEEGLSLVELLVAITILAIVVLFSSTLFINSFRTTATMENRTKALQIANDVVAVAEQSPYRRLYTPTMSVNAEMFNVAGSANSDKCDTDPRLDMTNPVKFGGVMVKQPTDYTTAASWKQHREFPGLYYCQERFYGQDEAEQVGTTFYVQTDIMYANMGSSDTPSRGEAGNTPSDENLKSKRVVVTVKWKDTHSGESESNKVALQRTITPNVWDCPVGYVTPPISSTSTSATSNGLLGC